jgi:hypothetical protein
VSELVSVIRDDRLPADGLDEAGSCVDFARSATDDELPDMHLEAFVRLSLLGGHPTPAIPSENEALCRLAQSAQRSKFIEQTRPRKVS